MQDAVTFQESARDFDFLGYRYSLMSSIGTGGLNNVINMLPARDKQEFNLLPLDDIQFVRNWLAWTDKNVGLLQRTRVIPQLNQPSAGLIDGVIMLIENRGIMFVYNPSAKEHDISLPIDNSLGFSSDANFPLVVTQSGSSIRGSMSIRKGIFSYGESFNFSIPATTALAFEFELLANFPKDVPLIFGIEINNSFINATSNTLNILRAQGESGTSANVLVILPKTGINKVEKITINDQVEIENFEKSFLHGLPILKFMGRWSDPRNRFSKSQEIGNSSGFTGGLWRSSFKVPDAVIAQLEARNKSYPVIWDLDPNGNNDANVPWLAPGRLLIFAKYKPLLNDSFNATGSIDGEPLIIRKAYNTVVPSSARFIGYWADVTDFVKPGTLQTLTINLPNFEEKWLVKSGALLAGNDILTLNNVTLSNAKLKCESITSCVGFTYRKTGSVEQACGIEMDTVATELYLKSSMSRNGDGDWCSIVKPAVIDGVFFENVETLYTADFTPQNEEY